MDTQRVRQKILDLAIRGKLVEQDPADEPASELLARVCAEKLAMVERGELKPKDVKGDSVIFLGDDNRHYEKVGDKEPVDIEDELPFELPAGWAWARVGVISLIGTGATPLKSRLDYYENGTVPWITSSSACKGVICEPDGYITETALAETNCTVYNPGALVVAMYGEGKTRGSVSILGIQAATNQACAVVQVIQCAPKYVKACYEQSYDSLRRRSKGGLQPNLNMGIIKAFLIPVPPLAEQHRIVAALDEYLGLVDSVEADEAALEELAAKARAKVLDLAIRGKLVEQDPADEPASELLARVHAEKLAMVERGELKPKDVAGDSVIWRGEDNSYYEHPFGDKSPQKLDGVPFDLPKQWQWSRLGFVSNYGESPTATAGNIPDDAWVLDLEDIEKGTGEIIFRSTKQDRPFTSSKRSFRRGQLLYSKLRPYLNKVLVAPENGYCTSEILPVNLYGGISPYFIRAFLMSEKFLSYANQCSYGVKMPRLGTNDGRRALVPIPPLKEQDRIAGAIDLLVTAFDSLTRL